MIFHINGCTIDTDSYEIRRDGRPVAAEPQVFDLLVVLLENAGKVVTKDQIIDRVWNGRIVSDSALSSRIKSARQVIGDDGTSQKFIQTVRRRGFRLVGDHASHAGSGTEPTERVAGDSPDRAPEALPPDHSPKSGGGPPSLMVLPFDCMSGDQDFSYFAEGMTETLATDLSRISMAVVIAPTTARAYRDEDIDPRKIERELGVNYVVRGSLQRTGPTLRVNVQFVDARSGGQLWSERFDGDSADFFALQDQVTSRIANSIGRKIAAAAIRDIDGRAAARNVTDFFMRGIAASDQPQSLLNLEQQEHYFRRAISLDPAHAEALARLARAILLQEIPLQNSASVSGDEARLAEAADLVQRALAIDTDNASAHLASSLVHQLRGNPAGMVFASERAIVLDRNLALAHGNLASAQLWLGRPAEALRAVEQAIRLDPLSPQFGSFQSIKGRIHIFDGRFDAALDCFSRAEIANPGHVNATAGVSIAYSLRGDLSSARDATQRLLEKMPAYRLSHSLFAPLSGSSADYRKIFEETVVPAAKASGIPI